MSLKFIFITTIIMVIYSLKMASTTISIVEEYEEGDRNLDPHVRVQCSYLYSVQIYMALIQSLLIDKYGLENVPQGKDLSYTKQAAKINATFYNVVEMQNTGIGNLMRIFSLYAERVLKYMESVIQKDQAEDQANIISAHNSVELLLVNSNFCRDYNKGKKLDVTDMRNIDDLDDLLATLESKTSVFMQRIDINANQYGISTAEHDQFNLNKLSLNGLLANMNATKEVLEISGVELNWDKVLRLLKKDYDLGTQANGISLSQQIMALKEFNNEFALMGVVIIIRLMLKSIMYTDLDCTWSESAMVRDIDALENYLAVQDDVEFVKSMIQNDTRTVDNKKNTIDCVNNYLRKFLSPYNDPNLREFKKSQSCTDFQQGVKRFVEIFKDTTLFNINFKIMKNFRQLVYTDEYKQLIEFENYRE